MARSYRNPTRISRPLIGALSVTIVLGGAIYLKKNHRPKTAGAQTVLPGVIDVKPAPAPVKAGEGGTHLTGQLVPLGGGQAGSGTVGPLMTQTPFPNNTNSSSNPSDPVNKVGPSQLALANTRSLTPANVPPIARNSAPVKVSAGSLVEGKAKKEAGDLLAARTLINDALLSGQLSEADSQGARQLLSEISQVVVFSKKPVDRDPYTETYQVASGERLARIADRHNVTWELLCRVNGMPDPKRVRAGQNIKLINGPFHAVINKSKFRLDLYLGNAGGPGSVYVSSFPVGLGKDNSTPPGLWMLQQGSKAHPATYYSPRGEGVLGPDDPKNPLGGYWMGLIGLEGEAVGKVSYGIHGTIEPDSIGKQASLGCIRLGHDDIAFLYDLLVDGKSKVMVKD